MDRGSLHGMDHGPVFMNLHCLTKFASFRKSKSRKVQCLIYSFAVEHKYELFHIYFTPFHLTGDMNSIN